MKTSTNNPGMDRVQHPLALKALEDAKAIVTMNGSNINGLSHEAISGLLEPAPKVVEQYQYVVIQPVLREME